jgi:O-antigen ligase
MKEKGLICKLQFLTEKLSFYTAFGAVFTISFPIKIMNISFVIWMIACALEVLFKGKYHIQKLNKQNLCLYAFIALYVWMTISMLWTSNIAYGWAILMQRFAFLAIPLLFLLGAGKQYKIKQILLTFVLGTKISILTLIVFGVLNYLNNPQSFISLEQYGEYIISMYKHRTYFSLSISLSLLVFVYLKDFLVQKISAKFYYGMFFIVFILFFCIILFLGGRMSLIIYLVLSISIVVSILWERKFKKALVISLLFFIIGLIGLMSIHPRMQNFSLDKEKLAAFDPRYELWRNGIQCIEKSNKLIGVGVGDFADVFNENLLAPGFRLRPYYDYTKLHIIHNQFLDMQLDFGFVGVILLIGLFLSFFIGNETQKAKKFIYNSVLIWFLFMMIDSFGYMVASVYLFTSSVIFIYWIKMESLKVTRI